MTTKHDTFNLDEARAARLAEEADTGPTFIFGGKEFSTPVELPAEFPELLLTGRLKAAFAVLLGPEDNERFFGLAPSVNDLKALADHLAEAHGLAGGLPNSSASGDSSSSTTAR